jgi:hypothetical protein
MRGTIASTPRTRPMPFIAAVAILPGGREMMPKVVDSDDADADI